MKPGFPFIARLIAITLGVCLSTLIPIDTSAQNLERRAQRNQTEDQIIKQAKDAVAAQPASAEAHFLLGQAYAQAERLEESIDPLKEAIQLKADYEPAYLLLGTVYEELTRYEEEILAYKNGLVAIPKSVAILDRLSRTLIQRRRLDEALEIQRQLVELKPDDARARAVLGWILINLRRYYEAIAALNEAVRLQPENASVHFNLGVAYANVRRLEEALAEYRQSLEVDPPYSRPALAYTEISQVLKGLRRYDESIQAGRKAIEIEPRMLDAYCHVARCYYESGRYQEAIDVLKAGLTMLPNDAVLTISLGDNYAALGKPAEAEKAYREVMRATNGSVESRQRLASVLSKQGRDAEAEALLRGVGEVSPKNTNAHLTLASSLERQGKIAEADKEYRKALELEPNNPLVLNNVGYSMLERGVNLEEALKMIQRAIEAAPGEPAYLDSLGFAYFKLGKYAEGEQPLLEAARQLPNVPDIQEHLGDLYAGWRKPEQARAAWQRAISLSTDASESARLKKKLGGLTSK